MKASCGFWQFPSHSVALKMRLYIRSFEATIRIFSSSSPILEGRLRGCHIRNSCIYLMWLRETNKNIREAIASVFRRMIFFCRRRWRPLETINVCIFWPDVTQTHPPAQLGPHFPARSLPSSEVDLRRLTIYDTQQRKVGQNRRFQIAYASVFLIVEFLSLEEWDTCNWIVPTLL